MGNFLIIHVEKSLTIIVSSFLTKIIDTSHISKTVPLDKHCKEICHFSSFLFSGLPTANFHGNLQHIVEDQHGCQWSYHQDYVALLHPWVFSSDLCLHLELLSSLYQSTLLWWFSKLLSIWGVKFNPLEITECAGKIMNHEIIFRALYTWCRIQALTNVNFWGMSQIPYAWSCIWSSYQQ